MNKLTLHGGLLVALAFLCLVSATAVRSRPGQTRDKATKLAAIRSKQVSSEPTEDMTKELLNKINEWRAQIGLSAVYENANLRGLTLERVNLMDKEGHLSTA